MTSASDASATRPKYSTDAYISALVNILEDSEAERARLQQAQRAVLNILEDFSDEKVRLQSTQSAVLNILEDFSDEKTRLQSTQSAVLNILEDFSDEKTRLQSTQSAVLNILEDFSDEKTRLQSTQSAVLNILEDFSDEKVRLQSTQSAVLNILEDFSSEKGRLQDMQRAVINILDDLQGDNQKLTVAQRSLTLLTTDLESRVRQRTEELSDVNVALRTKAEQLSSASKYKSEFLANMSHELRTPLNSILLLAKLLADNDDGNLTTKQEQYANVIVSAGTDLLALISDILDLSKIEAGKMEIEATSFDIDALLQHLRENFEPVARVRGLEFIASRGRGVPSRVHTDRQRLEQVLRNLLSNAFKFTSAGRVSLHVGFPLAAGEQAFGQAGVDGRREFTFSVLDTGVGIAEDQQSLIFEAFRQADGTTSRKYGGTGLGLSISTSIAKLLGGNLDVASVPGRGSLFTLTIPHGPSAATQVTAPT